MERNIRAAVDYLTSIDSPAQHSRTQHPRCYLPCHQLITCWPVDDSDLGLLEHCCSKSWGANTQNDDYVKVQVFRLQVWPLIILIFVVQVQVHSYMAWCVLGYHHFIYCSIQAFYNKLCLSQLITGLESRTWKHFQRQCDDFLYSWILIVFIWPPGDAIASLVNAMTNY